MLLEDLFKELFSFLKSTGYAWQAPSPDRLLEYRKTPERFDPLVRYFGLGLNVEREELCHQAEFSRELYDSLTKLHPAISSSGDKLIAHSHWPASADHPEDYVYLGPESFELLQRLDPHINSFIDKSVLDLGSGSGVLSFKIASLAKQTLGLETSRVAVEWATACARAQNIQNTSFNHKKIGTPQAEATASGNLWDIAIFNPPLTVPSKAVKQPHRDGGKLGVEIPLLFFDFAWRHLCHDGQVFCTITNPICQGQNMFFKKLDSSRWEIRKKKCLHHYFNQGLARKDNYRELGIDQIELWFLHLIKR